MVNHLFSIILFLPFFLFSQEDLKYYEKYMPESSCGEIIHYNYYSVSFCEDYKLSEWAIYYKDIHSELQHHYLFSCDSNLDLQK